MGLEQGPLSLVVQLRNYLEEIVVALVSKAENMSMEIHCADHATPLYPQKLSLTSPTSGSRLVSIVCSWTKATKFSFSLVYNEVNKTAATWY
jgi:hypothetical protein